MHGHSPIIDWMHQKVWSPQKDISKSLPYVASKSVHNSFYPNLPKYCYIILKLSPVFLKCVVFSDIRLSVYYFCSHAYWAQSLSLSYRQILLYFNTWNTLWSRNFFFFCHFTDNRNIWVKQISPHYRNTLAHINEKSTKVGFWLQCFDMYTVLRHTWKTIYNFC